MKGEEMRCDKCNTEVDEKMLTEKKHYSDGAMMVFKLCERCIREPMLPGGFLLNEGGR
jgi:hypothetical protein